MQRAGLSVPVRVEAGRDGYGENTVVWVPDNLDPNVYSVPHRPLPTRSHTVTITNVLIGGPPHSFQYNVTVFDPDTPPPGTTFTL